MKKHLLTKLIFIIFTSSMTTGYADIWVNGHGSNYQPKTGYYDAKIESVQIGYSTTTDADGNMRKRHNYVYLDTRNEKNEDLSFSFSKKDLPNGLAMMNAIGKHISVHLTLDNNDKLVVETIVIR